MRGSVEIAIIDDQSTSRLVMSRLVQDLEAGLTTSEYSSAAEALDGFKSRFPDLIIVDHKMPGMTGTELIRQLRATPGYGDVPIVMITATDAIDVRREALDAGASDFLQRPVDHAECRARVRNHLRMRHQSLQLKDRANNLEHLVSLRTRDILAREQETIFRLAKAGEFRDEETGDHVLRMSRYSRLIAEQLGLTADHCHRIEIAAPMHDIGKIGIPDAILLKQGRHTAEERKIMQNHARIGHEILQDSPSIYLQLGATIALGHHERWDGAGYPNRVKGEDIPLEARIVMVADVFDALVTRRPYKSPWSFEDAITYLKGQSGEQFDPQCVVAFNKAVHEIRAIHDKYVGDVQAYEA
jgi:two-component system response regulator RpfG